MKLKNKNKQEREEEEGVSSIPKLTAHLCMTVIFLLFSRYSISECHLLKIGDCFLPLLLASFQTNISEYHLIGRIESFKRSCFYSHSYAFINQFPSRG